MIDICVVTAEIDCYKTNGLYKLIDNLNTEKNKIDFFYIIKVKKNYRLSKDKKSRNHAKYLNFFYLDRILNANLLIIDGFRFPDRLITNMRRLSNRETIYIQHGRYTRIKRNYFSNHVRIKFIGYFSLLIRLFLKKPIKTFIATIKRKTLIEKGFLYEPLNYWENYHYRRNICFRKIIATPDTDLSKFNLSKKIQSKNFLYLAQSIYEDGRCSLKNLENFYKELINFSISKKIDLIVRPHPRSNLDLLAKYFKAEQILKSESTELPNTLFTITHHSALAVFFLEYRIPTFFYRINQEELPKGLIEYNHANEIKSFKEIRIENLKNLIEGRSKSKIKLKSSHFDIFKNNIFKK